MKPVVVILQVRRLNVGKSGVEMVKNLTSGGVTVADVLVLQRVDRNFINGQE